MTNEQFKKLHSDTSFSNKVKRFYNSYYYSNQQTWEYISIFDPEDLKNEAWIKIWQLEDDQKGSFYLTVIDNHFKNLLRKAKRRKKIAPKAKGEFLRLTYFSPEGKEFKAIVPSSEILYGESYNENI